MSDRYAPVGHYYRSTPTSQFSMEPPEPWMADGLCNGLDGDMWFADPGQAWKVAEAKAICRMCPSRDDCLEYSLRKGEKWGIWGALTAAERDRMIKPSKGSILKCRFCGDEFRAPNGNYRYCEKHRTNADRAVVAKRPAA